MESILVAAFHYGQWRLCNGRFSANSVYNIRKAQIRYDTHKSKCQMSSILLSKVSDTQGSLSYQNLIVQFMALTEKTHWLKYG